jgi:hypothetical protein
MDHYRSNILTDAFIRELNLPPELEQNLINRQYRPDLDMGTPPRLANPFLRTFENASQAGGINLYPIENGANVYFRTRAAQYSDLPPISVAYDSEVTLGDFAGLMAFWVLGTNKGFPSDAFYTDSPIWQTNMLPALNDGLSAWVGHRYSGNLEVYKYVDYSRRLWAGKPCGGTNIACDQGENIRNVMMFDEANTTKDGVFPFVHPAGMNSEYGPVGSDLSALYIAAIFYDIAYEAGLGAHKADLILWKTVSVITNSSYFPMRAFGAAVQQATHALWPDGRYDQDVSDVLTSRGIPLNGVADFRENLPAAIGSPTTLEKNVANGFGSSNPDSQSSVNLYGAVSFFWNGYTETNAGTDYVAYQFYKHSKYGPCDKLVLTDGTFSQTVSNWSYNNDGTFYHEFTDRELGNVVVFAPGNHIRWMRSRQRCPNEATGFYAEDVRPFGFRVIKATPNGFSFTAFAISETATNKTYHLAIVDPSNAAADVAADVRRRTPETFTTSQTSISASSLRDDSASSPRRLRDDSASSRQRLQEASGAASYTWTFTSSLGAVETATGNTVQYTAQKDEPFTLNITRTRNNQTDTLTLRERGNDLDRNGGNAFVRNLIP